MNQDMVRKQKKYRRTWISFAVILFLLLLVFFSAINTGSLSVSFGQLLRGLFVEYDENVAAVYDLRFPRILISMLAGAAIAVSGVLFQAVLKNPLADPGIIGISSGAGFAAVCVSTFFPTLYFFTPFAAFFGGVAAFFLVYCLSWKQGLSPLRIILTGVAVDALFTGLSSIFSTMTGGQRTGVASIVEANITQKTWSDVGTLFPYVLAGLFLAILFVGECNLLSLEDKTARGLGINVNRTRIVISLTAVLLASVSTAVAGAVSFLGLIVPHIGRLLVGSDHKVLIPFSTLAGAFTFLLADTIGRTIAAPYEVSAAVIMSVVGVRSLFFCFGGRKNMETNAMEVKNLSFSYGSNQILSDISLTIPRGKITTIMGANGCGKSTLFSLMTKNLTPGKGKILLEEKSIKKYSLSEFARKVSIVHQHNSAAEDITIERLVSYGRTPYQKMLGGKSEEDERLIEQALQVTGLLDLRDREIGRLSGGQRQRVWIAMALAHNTELLFLDEPTTYLDIRYQLEILELVKKLNKEFDITIVMVLHDINQTIYFSDKIIGLQGGHVAIEGAPDQVITEESIQKLYGVHLMVTRVNGSPVVAIQDYRLPPREK